MAFESRTDTLTQCENWVWRRENQSPQPINLTFQTWFVADNFLSLIQWNNSELLFFLYLASLCFVFLFALLDTYVCFHCLSPAKSIRKCKLFDWRPRDQFIKHWHIAIWWPGSWSFFFVFDISQRIAIVCIWNQKKDRPTDFAIFGVKMLEDSHRRNGSVRCKLLISHKIHGEAINGTKLERKIA